MGYDMYLAGIGAVAWVLMPDQASRPIVLSVGGPVGRIRGREDHIVRTTRAVIRRHLGS